MGVPLTKLGLRRKLLARFNISSFIQEEDEEDGSGSEEDREDDDDDEGDD